MALLLIEWGGQASRYNADTSRYRQCLAAGDLCDDSLQKGLHSAAPTKFSEQSGLRQRDSELTLPWSASPGACTCAAAACMGMCNTIREETMEEIVVRAACTETYWNPDCPLLCYGMVGSQISFTRCSRKHCYLKSHSVSKPPCSTHSAASSAHMTRQTRFQCAPAFKLSCRNIPVQPLALPC